MARISENKYTQYQIIFFPFATYKRIGDVELLTVLGIHVYKRVGETTSLLGFVRKAKA